MASGNWMIVRLAGTRRLTAVRRQAGSSDTVPQWRTGVETSLDTAGTSACAMGGYKSGAGRRRLGGLCLRRRRLRLRCIGRRLGSGCRRRGWLPAQFNRGASADLDRARVLLCHLLRPHNMWGDGEHNLSFPVFSIVLSEQILKDGKPAEPGIAAQRLRLRVLQDAAQQVDFAICQPGRMLDAALADDGLCDSANRLRTGYGGDLQRHLQGDFAVGMNVRSNIDVHADIQILELSADQGTNAASTNDAGLERAGGDRYTVADPQCGLLVIQSSDLGVLQELGVAIARQERERTS